MTCRVPLAVAAGQGCGPNGMERGGNRRWSPHPPDSVPSKGQVSMGKPLSEPQAGSPTGSSCLCSEHLNSRARHGVQEMVPEVVQQRFHQHQTRTWTGSWTARVPLWSKA